MRAYASESKQSKVRHARNWCTLHLRRARRFPRSRTRIRIAKPQNFNKKTEASMDQHAGLRTNRVPDLPIDFRIKYISVGVKDHSEPLEDVDKNFVLLVFASFAC